jgi:SAM-dependent methyltransferase
VSTSALDAYVLAGGATELERLRLQAQVWEPEAEVLFDRIEVGPGSRCIDLGCGVAGILAPLSRCVGPLGRVIGVDRDCEQLRAARSFVQSAHLLNVEVLERDAYATGLPSGSFDVAHARFLLAPVGRGEELVAEMLRLVRPGGYVVLQEPDGASWRCHPADLQWDRLKHAIVETFARAGGNFDAGRGTYRLLRWAGIEHVDVRTAVLALPPGHPYQRLPVQFAISLRTQIIDGVLLTAADLDAAIERCEEIAADPESYTTTFTLTQVWGRRPHL